MREEILRFSREGTRMQKDINELSVFLLAEGRSLEKENTMATLILTGEAITVDYVKELAEKISPARALWRPAVEGSVPMARLENVSPIWVATVSANLRNRLDKISCDLNVVHDNMTVTDYKAFVVDMDSTLIAEECMDLLGDLAHVGEQVRLITQKAMTGKLRFEDSLRQRANLLVGQPASILQECVRFVTLSPGAEYLVKFFNQYKLETWILSGGLTEVAQPVVRLLKMNGALANTLEVDETGCLTGRIYGPHDQTLFNGESKRQTVADICRRLNITPRQVISAGDGANDVEMVKLSGLGVAYHPKPLLRSATTFWLNYSGLDTIAAFFMEDWAARADVIEVTF